MTDTATVDIACRGARDFVRTYFAALDSETRAQTLPLLHRPSSVTTWNGSPLTADLLPDFFSKLPSSRHEVQSIDVHPVLGTTPAPLQVTAAGVALHFDGSNGAPPPQATAEFKKPKGPEDIARMPRVFHASFLLLPQGTAGPDAEVRYYIGSALYRFVG